MGDANHYQLSFESSHVYQLGLKCIASFISTDNEFFGKASFSSKKRRRETLLGEGEVAAKNENITMEKTKTTKI